jgi:osmotically inducible protein OsmC
MIIHSEKIETGTTTVTAYVSIGKLENKGFRLAVTLEVEVPDVEKAKELVSKAHEACTYSNATPGSIEVQ